MKHIIFKHVMLNTLASSRSQIYKYINNKHIIYITVSTPCTGLIQSLQAEHMQPALTVRSISQAVSEGKNIPEGKKNLKRIK